MPIASLSADLDAILLDAGVPVVSAASSTYGTLKQVDTVEQTDGDAIQKRGTMLRVRTGTIADLAVDLSLTVNGKAYVARWFELQHDGTTQLLIAEAT